MRVCWERGGLRSNHSLRGDAMKKWSLVAVISMIVFAPCCGKDEAVDWDTFAQSVPSFLYVLTGSSGTFVKDDGDTETYTLKINAVSPDIIYFSDRPDRIAGDQSLLYFISSWDAYTFNLDPPNAAIVLHEESAEEDVIIVEITEAPLYDPFDETLTCKTRILKDTHTGALAAYADAADTAIPENFESISLFIDSCQIITFDPRDAISFDRDSRKTVGYITYLKVNGQVFENDLQVTLPADNGTDTAGVAGILRAVSWLDNSTDTLRFNFIVSSENRRLAAGQGLSSDRPVDVAYAFDIYSFDNASGEYIKISHSNEAGYGTAHAAPAELIKTSDLADADLFIISLAFQSSSQAGGFVDTLPWDVFPPALIAQSADSVAMPGSGSDISEEDRLAAAIAWQYSFVFRYSFNPYKPRTMHIILTGNCDVSSEEVARFSITLTPDGEQSNGMTCTITKESGGFDLSQVDFIPLHDNNTDIEYQVVSTDADTRVIQFQQQGAGQLKYYRVQIAPINALAASSLCAGLQIESFPDVIFSSPVVPLIVRSEEIQIEKLSNPSGKARTLYEHLKLLFDLLSGAHAGCAANIHVAYTYPLDANPYSTLWATLPVLLSTGVTVDNTDYITAQYTESIKHWYTTNQPAGGGIFIIKIEVLDANNSPFLKLENLSLNTAQISDLGQ